MGWIISKAMMDGGENSRFSPALAEEFSAENYSDGGQSAPSRSILTPQAYCAPGKMKGFSNLSRYGMTFGVLTADRGAELLTLFLAGFLVRIFQPPENKPESTAPDPAYGAKWRALSVRYDRDSHGWKTAQTLWETDLPESSVILPKWGMMRGGELWARMMSEHGIKEKEFGSRALWPTPTVCGNNNRKGASKKSGDGLATAVKKYPTPMSADGIKESGKHLNPNWVEWLMGWPIGWTATSATDIAFPADDCFDSEPKINRLTSQEKNRRYRLICLGNGQVPQSVFLAWNILK